MSILKDIEDVCKWNNAEHTVLKKAVLFFTQQYVMGTFPYQ